METQVQKMIDMVDKTVDMWKNHNKLFQGGCCYSAGVISKELEKKHIEYKVMAYIRAYYNCENKSLDEIANDCALIHVAIEVGDKIIGGDMNHFMVWKYKYSNISSNEIMKAYNNNMKNWNETYDTKLNPYFKEQMEHIFSQF